MSGLLDHLWIYQDGRQPKADGRTTLGRIQHQMRDAGWIDIDGQWCAITPAGKFALSTSGRTPPGAADPAQSSLF